MPVPKPNDSNYSWRPKSDRICSPQEVGDTLGEQLPQPVAEGAGQDESFHKQWLHRSGQVPPNPNRIPRDDGDDVGRVYVVLVPQRPSIKS